MLIPKYVVTLNGKYMQIFESHVKAYELMQSLQRRFPRAEVDIEPYYD